jgi:hypothetical protein
MADIDIKDHVNWHPSLKLYYSKYENRIIINDDKFRTSCIDRYIKTLSFNDQSDVNYRVRHNRAYGMSMDMWGVLNSISVYTSHHGLTNYLLENYHIKEVSSPGSIGQAKMLHDVLTTNRVVRSKLFYNKYRYKIDCGITYRRMRELQENLQPIVDAIDWLWDTYQDTDSKVKIRTPIYFLSHFNLSDIPRNRRNFPIIYTNDEQSFMMFKLAYGNVVDLMNISEAVVLSDIK